MVLEPVAFSIFGLDIRWYGISYVVGFLFAYFFVLKYSKDFGFDRKRVEDIFFYFAIFSVLGGRLAHIIFYEPIYYFNNPLDIFAVWKGGMSIHGGILAGFLTLFYFSKKDKFNLLKLTDLFVIPAAFALALGRLANFVNQELVGTVTSSKLGVVFPLVDNQTRWPVTIFESFKNILVFNILYFSYTFKKLKPGFLTGLFLILYAFGRFITDFLREPEVLVLGLFPMGQILNLVTGFLGVYLLYKIRN